MSGPANLSFRAAREAAGCKSSEILAVRLAEFARERDLGKAPNGRQIRRWEAGDAYPSERYGQMLQAYFRVPLAELGFHASDGGGTGGRESDEPPAAPRGAAVRRVRAARPARTGVDYHRVTVAYRHLYQLVDPEQLYPSVVAQVRLGESLLNEMSGAAKRDLAVSLAEVGLLAGRIEFFDLGQPAAAADSFRRALEAASVADDRLLGAAILGHFTFIPGWAGERERAAQQMRAARTYARRGDAPGTFIAWLDAVEAECAVYCHEARRALSLINHAEDELARDRDNGGLPDWFCWFSPAQLASFRGGVELALGHLPQARATLTAALAAFKAGDNTKQQAVVLGDLAAVAVAQKEPEDACGYLIAALDLLETTAYETALNRVRAVREELDSWAHTAAVKSLDDRLYGWQTMLSGLR